MRAGMGRNPISHNPVDYRIRRGFWAALPDAGRYPKSRIRRVLGKIGARGFEPPTSRTRTVEEGARRKAKRIHCAIRLRRDERFCKALQVVARVIQRS